MGTGTCSSVFHFHALLNLNSKFYLIPQSKGTGKLKKWSQYVLNTIPQSHTILKRGDCSIWNWAHWQEKVDVYNGFKTKYARKEHTTGHFVCTNF